MVILVVAAVLRLALLSAAWHNPGRLLAPDSRVYIQLSENLARGGVFERDGQAELFRTPGYPLFLTLFHSFGEGWWRVASVAQVAADVLLVYLTFLLGKMLVDERAGLWAAGFQAICLVAISYSVWILTDCLFSLLLTLALLLAIHHFKTGRPLALYGSAVVAAASCYLRPVGIVFAHLLWVVVASRALHGLFQRSPNWGARFGRLAGVWAILATLVLPWGARNYLRADYSGLSTAPEHSFFKGEAAAVMAKVTGLPLEEVRARMVADLPAGTNGGALTPAELARAERRAALKIISNHPWVWTRVHLQSGLKFFLPAVPSVLKVIGVTPPRSRTHKVAQQRGLLAGVRHYYGDTWGTLCLAIVAVAELAAVWLCAAIGAIRSFRFRMGATGWLICLLMAGFILVGGPATGPRYRVPMTSLLHVSAAVGLTTVLAWYRRRHSRD